VKLATATTSKRRLSSEDTLALWKEYRRTNDRAVRDRLVLTFAPLVKYIVFKKVRELPARCEVEDLISCGLEALIRSLDRYDPDKGASLEQFVWTRIHGAVLDELRRQDWAPRSLRRAEREMARAQEKFFADTGRRADSDELAEQMGVEPGVVRRRQDELATCDVASLNAPVQSEEDTAIERIDTLTADDPDLDPELAAATHEAKDKFRRAFRSLPEREREVAVLLYVNNFTLREVGDVLGVTESRVCQIHSQLKRTLRTQLADETSLFAEVA
jgi:RNA polymerase sigma factor for flagellar operon FliA